MTTLAEKKPIRKPNYIQFIQESDTVFIVGTEATGINRIDFANLSFEQACDLSGTVQDYVEAQEVRVENNRKQWEQSANRLAQLKVLVAKLMQHTDDTAPVIILYYISDLTKSIPVEREKAEMLLATGMFTLNPETTTEITREYIG